MIDMLRSEWIKIRTVRVTFVLAIIALAIPLIVIVLVTALSSDRDNVAADFAGIVTGLMVLVSLLLGVIGALNLTSEYSHNTIRVTFAAAPQRVRVLLAKAIVTVAFTAVLAAIIEGATYLAGSIILSSRDAETVLSSGDKAAMASAVLLAALLAALGYGLGLIIRNSPATVALLILWPLLLENIAQAVLSVANVEEPTVWLPYQSAIQMLDPELGSGDPSRLHGALYLGAVVVGFIIIGLFVNQRRDA